MSGLTIAGTVAALVIGGVLGFLTARRHRREERAHREMLRRLRGVGAENGHPS